MDLGKMAVGGLLGGIAGYGKALEEDGKTKREIMLREMEMQFRSGEAEKDRTFRAGEGEKDRLFRSSEADEDRTFRAGEGDKDRAFRSTEAASDRSFRSGEAEKDRGFRSSEAEKERGERRGLLSKVDYDEQGNAIGVTQTGEKRDLGYKAPTKKETLTPAQALEEARRFATRETENEYGRKVSTLDEGAYNQRLRDLGFGHLAGAAAAPKAAENAEPLPAPTDAKQRKVGQVYVNQNGLKAEWTGAGWKRVD